MEKLLSEPPETVTSPTTKLFVDTVEVKVIFIVPSAVEAPLLIDELLELVAVILIEGADCEDKALKETLITKNEKANCLKDL